MFKVNEKKFTYSKEPRDDSAYTKKMDKIYSKFAVHYDYFMAVFPLWKKWLKSVLPYIQGDRIIDISFGPGYLFLKYPRDTKLHGLDYNEVMVARGKEKMKKQNISVDIIQGNVQSMPYSDEYFDTIINTMAFTGYPNGIKALDEMLRVLKKDGVVLMLDYDYPKNRNIFGYLFVKLIEKSGDIIKDIGSIIDSCGGIYERKIIGGFGSVQLFIIRKKRLDK